MGCRPSRNSLGRIADSTSEYNRCYIKELDKARRKQKKSALSGRRRAPTYNAFSSTSKCYERDEGASKITVRLSTDGSMLEIEQYDIDFTSNNDLISEASNDSDGIEMRPVGEGFTSKDILQNKRFSYGRCGSAPLLASVSLDPSSLNICKPSSSGALGNIDVKQASDASDISKDSISIANSNAVTEDHVHSIVAVNVHYEERLKYEKSALPNKDKDDIKEGFQKRDHCIGDAEHTGKLSLDKGQQKQCIDEQSVTRLIKGDNIENCGDIHRSTGGAFTKCLCKGIGKTICSTNESDRQNKSSECMYCVLTDGSNFKLVSKNESKSGYKEIASDCDKLHETSHIKSVDKLKHTEEINKTDKRHRLIENKNACDRFLSYCFLCEKNKWKNEEAYYACMNNKCHTLISPNSRDLGTDSNANVCCCRRYSSHELQKCIPRCNTNTDIDNRYSSLKADDKMSVSYQTRPNSSNSRDAYKYHPMNARNIVIANIDFQENERCKDVSGQSPFSPNESNVLNSDHLQCRQLSEKTKHACPSKECLEIICWENMGNYSGIRHTCCDKCETVTMETNDVSETTLRNDGQIRCYHSSAVIDETQFSRKGNQRLYCNEALPNVA
ncbi:uncharacterized protein LOC132730878 isoform X2 [Ruditapes philippinarum]|uniref:uncharacterized protein LOC132730878 isoform X2 n=1 Tax=Ruditapes philippinarum TaxID=129788 RepID=UPI00295BC78A|nr:uncharacterized protein LOC132730878 isoform X2 [Ruditapes philippinarum]